MPQTTGFTVRLTGMSLAGKSTLANFLAERLRVAGRRVEVLDADEAGLMLAEGLGSNKDERNLVVRRLGFVARLLTRNDTVVVAASVSPYREARDALRKEIGRFFEVFVDCPTEKLLERDTTGRYKKALAGEIPNFTGVTDPYEIPQHAEAIVRTDLEPVQESGGKILQSLYDVGYLKPDEMEAIMGKKVRRTSAKAKAKADAAKAAPKETVKLAAKPAKVEAGKPAPKAAAPKAGSAKAAPTKAAPAKAAPAKGPKAAAKPAPKAAAKPAPKARPRTEKAAPPAKKAGNAKGKAAPKAAKPAKGKKAKRA